MSRYESLLFTNIPKLTYAADPNNIGIYWSLELLLYILDNSAADKNVVVKCREYLHFSLWAHILYLSQWSRLSSNYILSQTLARSSLYHFFCASHVNYPVELVLVHSGNSFLSLLQARRLHCKNKMHTKYGVLRLSHLERFIWHKVTPYCWCLFNTKLGVLSHQLSVLSH